MIAEGQPRVARAWKTAAQNAATAVPKTIKDAALGECPTADPMPATDTVQNSAGNSDTTSMPAN